LVNPAFDGSVIDLHFTTTLWVPDQVGNNDLGLLLSIIKCFISIRGFFNKSLRRGRRIYLIKF